MNSIQVLSIIAALTTQPACQKSTGADAQKTQIRNSSGSVPAHVRFSEERKHGDDQPSEMPLPRKNPNLGSQGFDASSLDPEECSKNQHLDFGFDHAKEAPSSVELSTTQGVLIPELYPASSLLPAPKGKQPCLGAVGEQSDHQSEISLQKLSSSHGVRPPFVELEPAKSPKFPRSGKKNQMSPKQLLPAEGCEKSVQQAALQDRIIPNNESGLLTSAIATAHNDLSGRSSQALIRDCSPRTLQHDGSKSTELNNKRKRTVQQGFYEPEPRRSCLPTPQESTAEALLLGDSGPTAVSQALRLDGLDLSLTNEVSKDGSSLRKGPRGERSDFTTALPETVESQQQTSTTIVAAKEIGRSSSEHGDDLLSESIDLGKGKNAEEDWELPQPWSRVIPRLRPARPDGLLGKPISLKLRRTKKQVWLSSASRTDMPTKTLAPTKNSDLQRIELRFTQAAPVIVYFSEQSLREFGREPFFIDEQFFDVVPAETCALDPFHEPRVIRFAKAMELIRSNINEGLLTQQVYQSWSYNQELTLIEKITFLLETFSGDVFGWGIIPTTEFYSDEPNVDSPQEDLSSESSWAQADFRQGHVKVIIVEGNRLISRVYSSHPVRANMNGEDPTRILDHIFWCTEFSIDLSDQVEMPEELIGRVSFRHNLNDFENHRPSPVLMFAKTAKKQGLASSQRIAGPTNSSHRGAAFIPKRESAKQQAR